MMRLVSICFVAVAASLFALAPAMRAQAPTENPPPSAGHSLVYADDLEMVLLVNAGLGGEKSPPESTPTRIWGWTGDRWQLLDQTGPPNRNLGGVAYDSRRSALVLHGGGYSRDRSYADTWEWRSKGGWRKFTGAGPGVRDHTQMAYDSERGKAVLFGGQANETTSLGDTWEFDGATWTRVATSGPSARVHHAMQFDPVLKKTVVFGGTATGAGDFGDTWMWDGKRWDRLGADVTPRTHARMAFDRTLQRLLLLGGMPSGGPMNVAGLRTGVWGPLTFPTGPSARYLADAAFDAKRNVLVLFGGGDPAGMRVFNDTWVFDGTKWRKAT